MTQRNTGGNYLSGPNSNGGYTNSYSKLTTNGRVGGQRSYNMQKSQGGASHFDTYYGFQGSKPQKSDRSKGHSGGYTGGGTAVSSFNRRPNSTGTRKYTPRPTLTDLAIRSAKQKPWWK